MSKPKSVHISTVCLDLYPRHVRNELDVEKEFCIFSVHFGVLLSKFLMISSIFSFHLIPVLRTKLDFICLKIKFLDHVLISLRFPRSVSLINPNEQVLLHLLIRKTNNYEYFQLMVRTKIGPKTKSPAPKLSSTCVVHSSLQDRYYQRLASTPTSTEQMSQLEAKNCAVRNENPYSFRGQSASQFLQRLHDNPSRSGNNNHHALSVCQRVCYVVKEQAFVCFAFNVIEAAKGITFP